MNNFYILISISPIVIKCQEEEDSDGLDGTDILDSWVMALEEETPTPSAETFLGCHDGGGQECTDQPLYGAPTQGICMDIHTIECHIAIPIRDMEHIRGDKNARI